MTSKTLYRLVAGLAFINSVLAVAEILLHRPAWVICFNTFAAVTGFWCAHRIRPDQGPEVPPPEIDPRDSPYYVG